MVAALGSPTTLWYLARGSGLVLLGVLTANLVLGISIQGGWHPRTWPRFAVQAVHRNLALLAVVLLTIHVVTIELDPFIPVGWWAALVPFVSTYRPFWLGMGTLSLDILAAVVVTSLLRAHLRPRPWRLIHWLSYLSWPVAVLHSLGTGTDTRIIWVFVFEMACVGLVASAVVFRLARAVHLGPAARGLLMAVAVVAPMAAIAWSAAGPLQSGWAKRAGTPTTALAVRGTPAPTAGGAGSGTSHFTAAFAGTAVSSVAGQGDTIRISGRVEGGPGGELVVLMSASQGSDGALTVSSGTATYRPAHGAAAYTGQVVGVRFGNLLLSLASSGSAAVSAQLTLNGPVPASSVTGSFYFGTTPALSGGDDGSGGS
ncbi:MAG: hypothetical protein M0T72_03580 [Candidatus Dormibacteraeota bacterium]|jgi:sulfoxide reductase heme-binding subunit YedZ|nr:hypothetical protein [Candidatus Dormibacteraeota bacterium]